MQFERFAETLVDSVVSGQQSRAARRTSERPRLPLLVRLRNELARTRRGTFALADPQIRVDELRPRRQIDVADAVRAQHVLLHEVVLDRRGRSPQAELQIAQRLDRPRPIDRHADLPAKRLTGGGVFTASRLIALPRLEAGEAREGRRELGALRRFAGQSYRLVEGRNRSAPLVR